MIMALFLDKRVSFFYNIKVLINKYYLITIYMNNTHATTNTIDNISVKLGGLTRFMRKESINLNLKKYRIEDMTDREADILRDLINNMQTFNLVIEEIDNINNSLEKIK